MKAEILACIKKIKGNHFTYEKGLISGGYFSSFDILELVVELEEFFHTKIPLENISPENLDSVETIEELLLLGREKK